MSNSTCVFTPRFQQRFAARRACWPIVLLIFSGCGQQTDQAGQPVVLLAAASSTNALDEIRNEFRRNTGIAVQSSYAASSTLAQQIVNGAEADVFVSANQKWAEYLVDRDLVYQRRSLLSNRLVIVLPADSQLTIRKPEDLLAPEVRHLALADTSAVPAGMYARQCLSGLGLWERLREKVVAGKDVRQALSYVETGAAEAGIVYATDAAISRAVKVATEIPADLSAPIRYVSVLLSRAAGNTAANTFYEYLGSPAAAEVFRQHGFTVEPEPVDEKANAGAQPVSEAETRGVRSLFLTRAEWTALRLSFQVAVCAALAGLPFAVGIGYLLARSPFPGKWLVEAVVNLPLVLPPVVTGYLLLVCFAPRGPLGAILSDWFGVKIVFSWLGAALASAVVSFPLMVRAIRLAFQAVDPRLEMAARGLGASRTVAFFTVSLPLARRGVVAGWLLAFARSLGEFGATIMVAGNLEGRTRTIPLEIFTLAGQPGGIEQSWRLVGLSILLACGALAVSGLLERTQTRHESA